MDKIQQILFRRNFSISKILNLQNIISHPRYYPPQQQNRFQSSSTSTSENSPPLDGKPEPSTSNNAEEKVIKVSESCAKRLAELASNQNDFLRISVEGGGCSGFQYKFEIDNKLDEQEDRVFTNEKYKEAKVVVDSTSLDYLKGSTVDYHVELIKSAFRIVENPKAESGCSCGASFAVKLD